MIAGQKCKYGMHWRETQCSAVVAVGHHDLRRGGLITYCCQAIMPLPMTGISRPRTGRFWYRVLRRFNYFKHSRYKFVFNFYKEPLPNSGLKAQALCILIFRGSAGQFMRVRLWRITESFPGYSISSKRCSNRTVT